MSQSKLLFQVNQSSSIMEYKHNMTKLCCTMDKSIMATERVPCLPRRWNTCTMNQLQHFMKYKAWYTITAYEQNRIDNITYYIIVLCSMTGNGTISTALRQAEHTAAHVVIIQKVKNESKEPLHPKQTCIAHT